MTERTLIATTPTAMAAAHTEMAAWAKGKAAEITRELATLREELAIAKRNHWAVSGIERRIKREGKRLTFYVKIRKAIEAGLYVVPNFPAESVIAVRTDAKRHRKAVTGHYVTGWDFLQPPKRLPAGEGRYVGAQNTYHRGPDKVTKNSDGSEGKIAQYHADGFSEVEFPIALMSEETMGATERAMALKVFDEILECRDAVSCGDPMILGRIGNPVTGRPDMTFFIAWVMPLDRI